MFLDAVCQDVPNTSEKGFVVENRFSRVPALPEGSAPPDEPADLLADVRPQVLHEARQIAVRRSDEQVSVVGGKGEGEHLYAGEPCGPRQYTTEDFIRLAGRTEE
jgi:hypothetical protein